ncbi:MAG TPA: amidohydrolase family protein [Gemmatimonadota bacterium]|nr:amidohydrolase family protein [Gemmatimonadota bacterium]
MRGRLATTLIPLLLALPACADGAPDPAATPEPAAATVDTVRAFVGATVLPMDEERVLRDHTVVVEGDRIIAVGPTAALTLPETAIEIDARGMYLIPGLAEMHGHIPPPDAPAHHVESVLFLYVANGITTVRGMLGHPGQLDLKARAARGEIVAPNLYLAGPSFSGQSISSPEQAEARARQQAAEGWDLLKVHPGLTREEYDAMARVAAETGTRFGGHVPEDVGLLHAIEMGQETFDHIDGYEAHLGTHEGSLDEAALAEVVAASRAAGVWIVPTQILWETFYGTVPLDSLRSLPELRYAPPAQVRQWISAHEARLAAPEYDPAESRRRIAARMRILEALHDGGVRILMGTDAPQQFSVPGFSLHREIRRMTQAGMSPYQVLVTGTRNIGDYFDNEDVFGTEAPGQRADLVLLGANPLDDVGNVEAIEGVMVAGRWLPKAEIDARLAKIADGYAASE